MSNVFKFDAEIGRVLNLVINSIYTNKEIFLRELISNASDAINKRRYLSLSNPDATLKGEPEIKVKIEKTDGILVISDNGIGMNKEDLIANIGTIANSGTFKFIENLKNENSQGISAENMIGQFGVGFYSAFMVAEKIEVKTKKAGVNQVFLWKSEGKENFTIEEIQDPEFIEGTEIKLFIKPEMQEEFLDKFRIENIIKTYSNHVSFPIMLETPEGGSQRVNNAEPLWVKSPSETTEWDYQEFYTRTFWSPDKPFLILHNRVEGAQEYINLLFIPSKKPADLYNPERKTHIKLYTKRVFITEEGVKILPEYLRFVKGVVDSSDLPLNISRETLQNSDVLTKIGKSITKKIFSEFKKKLTNDRENYEDFWKEFGNVIKEGLCRPEELKDQIMDACLFYSSTRNKYITLDEYIEGMMPEQESIYFITAESIEDGLSKASLEVFKKKDIEVLILTDTVDDFWLTVVQNYKEKLFKNIAATDEKTDELLSKSAEKEEEPQEKEEGEKAVEIFSHALEGLVGKVKISYKLEESPVMLATESGAMSIRMERYLIEQKQLNHSSKKVLEINLKHPIVKEILQSGESEATKEKIINLYEIACIASGEALKSGSEFAKRMFNALN